MVFMVLVLFVCVWVGESLAEEQLRAGLAVRVDDALRAFLAVGALELAPQAAAGGVAVRVAGVETAADGGENIAVDRLHGHCPFRVRGLQSLGPMCRREASALADHFESSRLRSGDRGRRATRPTSRSLVGAQDWNRQLQLLPDGSRRPKRDSFAAEMCLAPSVRFSDDCRRCSR